jgi:hypothetical protein
VGFHTDSWPISARPRNAFTTAVDETNPPATSRASSGAAMEVSRKASSSSLCAGISIGGQRPRTRASLTGKKSSPHNFLASAMDSSRCCWASFAIPCQVGNLSMRLFFRGGIISCRQDCNSRAFSENSNAYQPPGTSRKFSNFGGALGYLISNRDCGGDERKASRETEAIPGGSNARASKRISAQASQARGYVTPDSPTSY